MKSIIALLLLLSPHFLYCQDPVDTEPEIEKKDTLSKGAFDTKSWLKDDLTVEFGDGLWSTNSFAGIRILFEPQLGIPFINGNNKFSSNQLNSIPKFGVETNLIKGYVALQAFVLFPSKVSFDEKSPIVLNNIIENGEVGLNAGLGGGFAFLDGIIAIGYGRLNFDNRDFDKANPEYSSKLLKTGFWFINVQPVSAVRKAIKASRN